MISKSLLGVGAAALLCTAAPSQAATVLDPAGDFLPSFAGPNDADLDVLSFSVDYDPVNMVFNLGAMLAGPINAARSGLYVIGVDTGSGARIRCTASQMIRTEISSRAAPLISAARISQRR